MVKSESEIKVGKRVVREREEREKGMCERTEGKVVKN